MRPAVLVLTSGCVFGGGPLVGVRLDHGGGYVAGGEVSAGLPVAQATFGMDTESPGYLRLDATWDAAGADPSYHGTWNTLGGRLGAGYRLGGDGGGMFVVGPSVSSVDQALSWRSGTSILFGSGVGAFVLYLDLRYEGGWQLVLNPRLEAHGTNFPGSR